MKYVAVLTDGIITSKGINYTDFMGENEIEITKEQYETMPIPCKIIDGKFVPTELPLIEAEPNTLNTAHFETGSYVGVNKFGSPNPTVLNFEFTPKIVFIHSGMGGGTSSTVLMLIPSRRHGFFMRQEDPDDNSTALSIGSYIVATWTNDNKTVSFYSNRGMDYQMNNNYTYEYFAIG